MWCNSSLIEVGTERLRNALNVYDLGEEICQGCVQTCELGTDSEGTDEGRLEKE